MRPPVASEVPFRTNSGIQRALVGPSEKNGQSRPWHCEFGGGGIIRSKCRRQLSSSTAARSRRKGKGNGSMSLKAKPSTSALRKSPLVKTSRQSRQLLTFSVLHHNGVDSGWHGCAAPLPASASAAVIITAPTDPPETPEIAKRRLRTSSGLRPVFADCLPSSRYPNTVAVKNAARLAP